MKTGIGQANYTFGELLQGQVNGRPFLVSLPIQHFAKAIFYPSKMNTLELSPEKDKVRKVIKGLRGLHPIQTGGTLLIEDSLPGGKGFATSTADMLAAARAFCAAFGINASSDQFASLLTSIEPTDGIMYDGLVAFYHKEGILKERLGFLPPFRIIGVDRGGEVDTLHYNQKTIPYTREEEEEFSELLLDLQKAMINGDSWGIGRIATRSGEIQQRRLPHPYFHSLGQIGQEEGGVGIVVAHSGTLAGILLDERDDRFTERVKSVLNRLKGWGLPIYQFPVGARKGEDLSCYYNHSVRVQPNTVP